MPKTRQQKEQAVQTLTDKVSKANSMVFTNYQGLTMTHLSQIRDGLRDNSGEFSIVKNNLIQIALKNANIEVPDTTALTGPTAALFAYGDEVAPIKALTKALKDAGIGEIKGGLLGTEYISAARVKQLADLPSKDQLRGQVVGALGGPLYGIVGVLQANLRNIVNVLDQIRKQKGGE